MADEEDAIEGTESSYIGLPTCSWHVAVYDRPKNKKGQKIDSIKLIRWKPNQ